MSSLTLVWLGGAMIVYLAASSVLRTYVANAQIAFLLGALFLYTIGNLMMVRLMRDSGMAVAISVSAVLQLVLATLVAVAFFGERPTGLQWAGIAFGVVAVALIVWPQQGAR
jgi:drug/metabolite transporter (DMT)-like permease